MEFSEEFKRFLEGECIFSATRSSGPGGQNVNKVNTRVELRFSIADSNLFSSEEKSLIQKSLKNKINTNNEIVFSTQDSRSQSENRQLVFLKFLKTLEKALSRNKERINTTPTVSSVLQRLESKKTKSILKQLRKPPIF